MNAWKAFILERFSPSSYLPMILVFTVANSFVALAGFDILAFAPKVVGALLMMFSFFFRMRLFDEIKDYEVDLKINPTRPLARGLLKVSQVKKAIAVLIVFELAIAAILGPHAFAMHAIAIFYSVLMYEEFFIGDLIRPHLTVYAVSHTFVSFLMGASIAASVTDLPVLMLSGTQWLLLLTNWFYFNLFEFARKTYAAEEERPGVDTYSSLYAPKGALVLCWSQVICAFVIYWKTIPHEASTMAIAAALYLGSSIHYGLRPSPASAKLFRNLSGIYLITHYVLWGYALWS